MSTRCLQGSGLYMPGSRVVSNRPMGGVRPRPVVSSPVEQVGTQQGKGVSVPQAPLGSKPTPSRVVVSQKAMSELALAKQTPSGREQLLQNNVTGSFIANPLTTTVKGSGYVKLKNKGRPPKADGSSARKKTSEKAQQLRGLSKVVEGQFQG
jgi:hypothetical protein